MFFNKKKKKKEAAVNSAKNVLLVFDSYCLKAGCEPRKLDILKSDPKVIGSICALSEIAANTDGKADVMDVFNLCFASIFNEIDHTDFAKALLIAIDNKDAIEIKGKVIDEFMRIVRSGGDPTESRIVTDTIKQALTLASYKII